MTGIFIPAINDPRVASNENAKRLLEISKFDFYLTIKIVFEALHQTKLVSKTKIWPSELNASSVYSASYAKNLDKFNLHKRLGIRPATRA